MSQDAQADESERRAPAMANDRVLERMRDRARELARLHASTYAGPGRLDVSTVAALTSRVSAVLDGGTVPTPRLRNWIRRCSEHLLDVARHTQDSLIVPYAGAGSRGFPTGILGGPAVSAGPAPTGGVGPDPVYADVAGFLYGVRAAASWRRTPRACRRMQRAFLAEYARTVPFRLEGRRQGLRLFLAVAYLRALLARLEARPSALGLACRRRLPWLHTQWVCSRYVWPMQDVMESIERREARRVPPHGGRPERALLRADRFRGQRAKDHDRRRQARCGRLLKWANEAAIRRVSRAAMVRAGRVLDSPCGTGRLVPLLGGAERIIGADISYDMIVEALERSRRLPHGRVRFAVMSARELGFRGRAFDCVFCVKFLHLLPPDHWRRVLEELARVSARYVVVTAPVRDGVLLQQAKSVLLGERRPQRQPVTWARLRRIVESANLEIRAWTRSVPLLWDEAVLLLERREGRAP